jgi:aspartyl-tRNA(Asn)/glutamyl-tRNA(Gln) amidotransferase subunit A
VQSALIAKFDKLWKRFDLIITPTMPDVAARKPTEWVSPYPDSSRGGYYTSIVNLAGGTALSYPCGLADGLPVGLQIVGRPGDEATVLRACRALEVVLPWDRRPRRDPGDSVSRAAAGR